MSELVWIPVPAGRIRDGKPVLSVVVTPRLTAGLAASGLADWPTAIAHQETRFTVRTRAVGATDPDAAGPTATLVSTPDPAVWQRFFGGIGVTPFTTPRGYHPPAVAPTSTDAEAVRDTYQRAAVTTADQQTIERELERWQGNDQAPQQPVQDAAQLRDAVPDFHRAVMLLREHPHVLRLLGLIVDLRLDGLTPTAGREISVTWDASPVPIVPRWTRYEFDGDLFLPAADGDIARGTVNLADRTRWRIITFDVDGAVGKLQGAARSLTEDRSRPAEGAPVPGARPTLPPMRSAGLMLTRLGREALLTRRSEQGLAAATGQRADQVLLADDLVLGYRIDVRPEDGDTWYSLHRRRATYRIGDLPTMVIDDEEGHVKPHAAVIDEHGLRTDEVVARWDGWSLSVPRPRLDGGQGPNRRRGPDLPYDFEVTYDVVPASLLELEFGRAYQVRARVVDLAGGGLELRDPAADVAANTETYVRHEPLPPPQVVPPAGLLVPDDSPRGFHVDPSVVGPGGSLEQLVIRSEPDGETFTTAPFDADPAYPANHRRELLAPLTTFTIAEQHGMLRLTDVDGAELAARASGAFVGDRAGETPVGAVSVNGLPDPAALGVAAAVLAQPGLLREDDHDERPWEGVWPQRVPKAVELAAGPAGSVPRVRWLTEDDQSSPDGQASPRVQLRLPPGCQVDVELTSTVLTDWIDRFALNRFLTAQVPADLPEADPNAAQNAMVTGRHPLLSPPRRLLATHAVRRPLQAAHGTAQVVRLPGETVAQVLTTNDPVWGIHVPSTGSLDITATWREWSDAPEPTDASAPVAQVNVPRGTLALPEVRHDFGDTKHRRVTFDVTGVSRFRDCFVDTDPALFRRPGPLEQVPVPSTARPRPPVVLSVVPAFAWHEERTPGTLTRHRLGGRLRVELARPWFTTGEGEALAVVVWPGEESALPEPVRELVTWCNRDPIQATPTLPALASSSQFTGFTSAVDVPLHPGGPLGRALVYPVFFHEGHWYADVELPGVAAASYAPFVRLAVARFQAESLVGPDLDLRMSSVVTAELSPVLPDRHLTITDGPGGLEITLSGLARLADHQVNRVVAGLERRAGPADDTGDLTSLSLGDPAFAAWRRVAGGAVQGVVGSPLPPLPVPDDAGPLRLVVREVEELHSNPSGVGVDAPDELATRTVFVDVVDLPVR